VTRRQFLIVGLATLVVGGGVLLFVWKKNARQSSSLRQKSPSSHSKMNKAFDLSEGSQRELRDRAASGDEKAAFALAEYHGFVTGNLKEYDHWLRRAASLGHVVALYNLGHELLDAGQISEARRYLEAAHAAAERSGDDYTLRLAKGELQRLTDLERTSKHQQEPPR
jgi:TPR repeat protein